MGVRQTRQGFVDAARSSSPSRHRRRTGRRQPDGACPTRAAQIDQVHLESTLGDRPGYDADPSGDSNQPGKMVTTETRTKPTVAAVFSASRRGVASWNPTIETRPATRERGRPQPGETSGPPAAGGSSTGDPEPGGPPRPEAAAEPTPTGPADDSPASTGEFDDYPAGLHSTAAATPVAGRRWSRRHLADNGGHQPARRCAPHRDASHRASRQANRPAASPQAGRPHSGSRGLPAPATLADGPALAERRGTPAASDEAAAWSMGADRSATSGWGALWRQSAQGWVEDPAGRAVWRPIVTTSATLSEWEVDTYLGLVTGDWRSPATTWRAVSVPPDRMRSSAWSTMPWPGSTRRYRGVRGPGRGRRERGRVGRRDRSHSQDQRVSIIQH